MPAASAIDPSTGRSPSLDFFVRNLQYLETPQFLRKRLFKLHPGKHCSRARGLPRLPLGLGGPPGALGEGPQKPCGGPPKAPARPRGPPRGPSGAPIATSRPERGSPGVLRGPPRLPLRGSPTMSQGPLSHLLGGPIPGPLGALRVKRRGWIE